MLHIWYIQILFSSCLEINFKVFTGSTLLFIYLGGWKLKVESRLTLMKEDTTLYHLVKLFNDRVCGTKCETTSDSLKNNNTCWLCAFCFSLLRSRAARESLAWQRAERGSLAALILLSVTLNWVYQKAAFLHELQLMFMISGLNIILH